MRALQLAFRRHLDTTPSAYLRRIRVDVPREELGWQYHDEYGKPPDETLRR
ncbi:hypothetical protein O7602_30675 [Micromonospora sp. WMMD1128]|uniref:hypothetical protein n=1 Tax=Micromonospora sp. WMMD1128 TaxID=3015150 RepID=UPI00248B993E|nr:hypothetical protein [Micromonospora sp. WMMD1128]WBB73957.1 hypothetical protein O7602_30675 [Micromonospora sp. WMMD1128]